MFKSAEFVRLLDTTKTIKKSRSTFSGIPSIIWTRKKQHVIQICVYTSNEMEKKYLDLQSAQFIYRPYSLVSFLYIRISMKKRHSYFLIFLVKFELKASFLYS